MESSIDHEISAAGTSIRSDDDSKINIRKKEEAEDAPMKHNPDIKVNMKHSNINEHSISDELGNRKRDRMIPAVEEEEVVVDDDDDDDDMEDIAPPPSSSSSTNLKPTTNGAISSSLRKRSDMEFINANNSNLGSKRQMVQITTTAGDNNIMLGGSEIAEIVGASDGTDARIEKIASITSDGAETYKTARSYDMDEDIAAPSLSKRENRLNLDNQETVTKLSALSTVAKEKENAQPLGKRESILHPTLERGQSSIFQTVTDSMDTVEGVLSVCFSPEGIRLVSLGVSAQARLDMCRTTLGCARSKRIVHLRIAMNRGLLVIWKIRRVTRMTKITSILMYQVREIRIGHKSLDFQRFGRGINEDLCFSIFFTKPKWRGLSSLTHMKVFNLICESKEQRDAIVVTLQNLVDGFKMGSFLDIVKSPNMDDSSLIEYAAKRIQASADPDSQDFASIVARDRGKRTAYWLARFHVADTNGDATLDSKELLQLLHSLGMQSLTKDVVEKMMSYFDVNGDKRLNSEEFLKLALHIKKKIGLVQIFSHLCGEKNPSIFYELENCVRKDGQIWEGPTVKAEMLLKFMKIVQGDSEATIEDAKRIIARFSMNSNHPSSNVKEHLTPPILLSADSANASSHPAGMPIGSQNKVSGPLPFDAVQHENEPGLDFAGFCDFLSSDENCAIIPSHLECYQDMSQPLSRYFCNSSHNTYLVSDQLVGTVSIETYVHCYRHGVRCVEVDSWDGPNGPMITHGHTLTEGTLLVEDFARITASEAFSTSPWPLIISLENHCGPEQQRIMAETFQRYFGDRLVGAKMLPTTDKLKKYLGLDGERQIDHVQRLTILPSPNDLRGKILIKAQVGIHGQVNTPELGDLVLLRIERFAPDSAINSAHGGNNNGDLSGRQSGGSAEELMNLATPGDARTARAKETIDILSGKGWAVMHNRPADSVLNLAENIVASPSFNIGQCREFTREHMVRVYPFGLRFDSSNMDPSRPFSAGCQLVAMNTQKSGAAYRMNAAVFSVNGGSKGGYIHRSDDFYDIDPSPYIIHLRILSGHNLPVMLKSASLDACVEIRVSNIADPFGVSVTEVFDKMNQNPHRLYSSGMKSNDADIVRALISTREQKMKQGDRGSDDDNNNGNDDVAEEDNFSASMFLPPSFAYQDDFDTLEPIFASESKSGRKKNVHALFTRSGGERMLDLESYLSRQQRNNMKPIVEGDDDETDDGRRTEKESFGASHPGRNVGREMDTEIADTPTDGSDAGVSKSSSKSKSPKNQAVTRVVLGNAFNPHWNQNFEIMTTHSKSSYLILTVKLAGTKAVAFFGAPIASLRSGFRVLPLYGKNVELVGPDCHLICYIEIKTSQEKEPSGLSSSS